MPSGDPAHVAGFIAPGQDVAHHLRAAGDRLFAVEASRPACALPGPSGAASDSGVVWPTVLDALREIAEHTRCAYELIVVDGASTDATTDVLQRAETRFGSRIRVIRESKK